MDDGVYVYSTGGYLHSREYNHNWWLSYGPRLFGSLLIVLGVALAIYSASRTWLTSPLRAMLATIPGFLMGAVIENSSFTTCYAMSEPFSDRPPEMVSLQRDLLEKYREKGVISEETYQRATSALPPQDNRVKGVEP